MTEQGQHLVHFIQPQRWLPLFKVADESQTHPGTVGQIALVQTQRPPFGFEELDQGFVHGIPIGCKFIPTR
jgi:hypothetical protein